MDYEEFIIVLDGRDQHEMYGFWSIYKSIFKKLTAMLFLYWAMTTLYLVYATKVAH